MALIEHFKSILFYYFLFKSFRISVKYVKLLGLQGAIQKCISIVLQRVITNVRSVVPGTNDLILKQVKKSVDTIQKDMLQASIVPGQRNYVSLPVKGLKFNEVLEELDKYSHLGHVDWRNGKISGAVYHGGKDLSRLITEAFSLFTVSNPLHPEIFPGVRKMEAEVVSMVVQMYHGGSDACGSMTSGGSESIIMSIKAHRDWAKDVKGITEPEMIIPVSAHAAFDKGASYLGIKLIHAPVDDESGCVLVDKVAAAINSNTILLVGSSPSFPHGSIDDIPALAALALQYNIGLHVDSCLGGFIVPFAADAGFPLNFHTDFRVKGVTAISCDTHKYGFAPKGSSVVMYHSKKLRKYQYFLQTDWPGGVYGSPTMAGSRPGALSAGCWATMIHFGHSGYVSATKTILTAAKDIKKGIEKIDGLQVIGEPLLSVVAFKSVDPKVNIYGIAEMLSKKEYHLNVLQFPPSIHIACTMLTPPLVPTLLKDLKEMTDALKKNPELGKGATAAIYGTAASVPDRNIIGDVVCGFLDGLTLMPPQDNTGIGKTA